MATPFSIVYDYFLSKVTDDLYLELNELDTYRVLQDLLMSAVHKFEFPRKPLDDYQLFDAIDFGTYNGAESDYEDASLVIYDQGQFNESLTNEEINILATYMIVEWLGYQLASIENVRQKYSGSDFSFTSQANHMSKLLTLKKDYEREGFHLQRLYKRRAPDSTGTPRTTLGVIMDGSSWA